MTIEAIAVVIPARNEERSIGTCLESVTQAIDSLSIAASFVVVVDDASTDDTGDVAELHLAGRPHRVIRTAAPNVGRARHLGVECAARFLERFDSERVWIAFTDADSVVPTDWLQRQVNWADEGIVAVRGIVSLLAEEPPNDAYEAHYARGVEISSHIHIHGANMGMTAATYVAIGGFASLRVGEDRDIWERLHANQFSVIADPRSVVLTSARRSSRVTGGLATYLSRCDAAALST